MFTRWCARLRRPGRPDAALASICAASLALVLFTAPALYRTEVESPSRLHAQVADTVSPRGGPLDDAWVASLLRAHRVPGVSVAVVEEGRISWARGYGLADGERLAPVDTLTLFQAASISKPIAAIGALRLVDTGTLSLDSDVNAGLTSWKVPENRLSRSEKVTLRRLLSHSAGTTVHGFRGYAAGQAVPTLQQVLDGSSPANSPPVRVDQVPGSRWRYSGGGTSIVQQLIVDATGEAFADLMHALVLQPLEMNSSTFHQPLPVGWAARAASGHNGRGTPIPGRWHTYPEAAAAGLWTTPSDLARAVIGVAQAHQGEPGDPLSVDLAREMLTVQSGTYALGFEVRPCGGHTCFSHGGANEGFRAYLLGIAETGDGIVVMTNGDSGMAVVTEVIQTVANQRGWPMGLR